MKSLKKSIVSLLIFLFCFTVITKNVSGGTASLHTDLSSGGTSSSSNLGHAWIEYLDDSEQKTTYATWPDHGVLINYDGDIRPSTAVTSIPYSDDQWKYNVLPFIQEEINKGDKAWSLCNNCSSFASKVWSIVTGQKFSANDWDLLGDTPGTLEDNINRYNHENGSGWGVQTSGSAGLESKPIQEINHQNFYRLVERRYFERKTK